MSQYVFRQHDDNDGKPEEGLHLIVGDDSDFFIFINDSPDSLRFRMPVIGGGKSPNTWFALRHLFEAISADNQKHQIQQQQLEIPFENPDLSIHCLKNNNAKEKIDELLNSVENGNINTEILKEKLIQIRSGL